MKTYAVQYEEESNRATYWFLDNISEKAQAVLNYHSVHGSHNSRCFAGPNCLRASLMAWQIASDYSRGYVDGWLAANGFEKVSMSQLKG